MATLEQIVYNIAENLQREHDQPFLERLRFMVPHYRSVLIKRDESKGRKVDSTFMQTLEEVRLKEIPSPLQGLQSNCAFLRSEYKLPRFVRLVSGPAIQAVTSTDGIAIIHPVAFEAIRTLSAGRYTGHEPRYFYRNQYLWVINAPALESVQVEAAFEDPIEAELFNDPSADLADIQYPISGDFISAVTEMIRKLEGVPADPTNDDVTINE